MRGLTFVVFQRLAAKCAFPPRAHGQSAVGVLFLLALSVGKPSRHWGSLWRLGGDQGAVRQTLSRDSQNGARNNARQAQPQAGFAWDALEAMQAP